MIQFLRLHEPRHSIAVVVDVADVEVSVLLATRPGELLTVLAILVIDFHYFIRCVEVKIHKVFRYVELRGDECQFQRGRIGLER